MNIFLHRHTKSIRLYPDGFSLFKKIGGKEAVSQDYPGTMISSLPGYISSFFPVTDTGPVGVIVDVAPPVLIPEPLFDMESAPSYLKLQFETSGIGKILTDQLDPYISLYFIDKETDHILDKTEVDLEFVHQSTLFCRYIDSPNFSFSENSSFLLYIDKQYAGYCMFKEGKIQLINRFGYTTGYDILYHYLNILKQYRMETRQTRLFLYNTISKEYTELFKTYTPHITLIS